MFVSISHIHIMFQNMFIDFLFDRYFGVPEHTLPEIRSSAEVFGHIAEGSLAGIPISGVSIDFFTFEHRHTLANMC